MLNVLDEFTHECLAIRVARKLKAIDVIDVLSDLFILRGVPAHIRSDNGPEFVAKAVQEWITAVGAKTAYIERGSPWENGYIESFNARLRDELLNGEIFYTLCARPRSSSKAGDATTTRSGLTPQSDTSHQHQRCSCPHSPRGRRAQAARGPCTQRPSFVHRSISGIVNEHIALAFDAPDLNQYRRLEVHAASTRSPYRRELRSQPFARVQAIALLRDLDLVSAGFISDFKDFRGQQISSRSSRARAYMSENSSRFPSEETCLATGGAALPPPLLFPFPPSPSGSC
jgi:Integrase core domain